MSEVITRRTLRFSSLAEALQDAEALHRAGWRRAGRWDLAQVCNHLADWIEYPMDGFPPAPLLLRGLLPVLRPLLGRRILRKVLAEDAMAAGAPAAAASVHVSGGDEAVAIDRLRRAVERLEAHRGGLIASPLFGALSHEEWLHLHRVHCAHHLGFLRPNGDQAQ